MEQLPLTILIDPAEEAIIFESELVAGLTQFELNLTLNNVTTTFVCANCFPRPSGHRIRGEQRDKYPLRIYVGDNASDALVSYAGHIIGHVVCLYVRLSVIDKRIIRITTSTPLAKELHTALLDLGVEIIVQSPDAPAAGDTDAGL